MLEILSPIREKWSCISDLGPRHLIPLSLLWFYYALSDQSIQLRPHRHATLFISRYVLLRTGLGRLLYALPSQRTNAYPIQDRRQVTERRSAEAEAGRTMRTSSSVSSSSYEVTPAAFKYGIVGVGRTGSIFWCHRDGHIPRSCLEWYLLGRHLRPT